MVSMLLMQGCAEGQDEQVTCLSATYGCLQQTNVRPLCAHVCRLFLTTFESYKQAIASGSIGSSDSESGDDTASISSARGDMGGPDEWLFVDAPFTLQLLNVSRYRTLHPLSLEFHTRSTATGTGAPALLHAADGVGCRQQPGDNPTVTSVRTDSVVSNGSVGSGGDTSTYTIRALKCCALLDQLQHHTLKWCTRLCSICMRAGQGTSFVGWVSSARPPRKEASTIPMSLCSRHCS
jgi:hypothetical protein